MGTTADKLEYLQGTKAAIKSAIVNKGVSVPDGTTFRGYADKIADIIDVPDLSNPGAAGDLRSGKQLVGADGGIITGTLAEVTQATPSISVSSGGLITASATQNGGIVEGGSKSATQQLPTQAAKTVTPGTAAQTAVASGRYTTGDVVVAGDANLVPENIAEGVSIFGVTGAHSGGGGNFTPPRYMAYSMLAFISSLGTLTLNGAQIFAYFIAAAQLVATSNYAWVNEEPPTPSGEIVINASNMSRFNTAIRRIMANAGNATSFNDLPSGSIGQIRDTIKDTFARIGVSVSYSDNVVAVSIGSDTLTINF